MSETRQSIPFSGSRRPGRAVPTASGCCASRLRARLVQEGIRNPSIDRAECQACPAGSRLRHRVGRSRSRAAASVLEGDFPDLVEGSISFLEERDNALPIRSLPPAAGGPLLRVHECPLHEHIGASTGSPDDSRSGQLELLRGHARHRHEVLQQHSPPANGNMRRPARSENARQEVRGRALTRPRRLRISLRGYSRTKMFFFEQMSLSCRGHMVTLTSPRWAFLRRYM